MPLHEMVGAFGTILILLGLYRVLSGKWTRKSIWYELDHFIGSVMLIYYLMYVREYYGVAINLIYALVMFSGIESYAKRRTFHKKKKRPRH